jgi:preprotein translocase subunit SecA
VKESVEIPEALGSIERYIVINAIDHHWQEHLTEMEELRRSIGLRSYGQKDPLVEYKGEAYKYFEELMQNVRLQICTGLFRATGSCSLNTTRPPRWTACCIRRRCAICRSTATA